jgi:hypothetical protein
MSVIYNAPVVVSVLFIVGALAFPLCLTAAAAAAAAAVGCVAGAPPGPLGAHWVSTEWSAASQVEPG